MLRDILAGAVLALALATGAQAAPKPNIVMVLVDDVQSELIARAMPAVREHIVDRGLTFKNAYFSDPLCCPSRSTMLTGKYNWNTKVNRNQHQMFYGAGNQARTFAVWLERQGYRVGFAGKYLNGYPLPMGTSYVPPGYADFAARAGGGENTHYYGYKLVEGSSVAGGKPKLYGQDEADYSTDVYGRRLLAFVDRQIASGAPIMLDYRPHAAHPPLQAASRHKSLFPGIKAPRPPSLNEADVSDKPAYVRATAPWSAGQISGFDSPYRTMAQMLYGVDENFAAIVARLKAAGRYERTIFVVAQDNGVSRGAHRLSGKGYPYNEVLNMGLAIAGPGIPKGQRWHLVSNADLAPTFAALAGAPIPADVDGRSLAPLLRAKPPAVAKWRQAVPLTHESGQPSEGPGPWRGLRTGRYTYVEYATGERELYDNERDKWQLENLLPPGGEAKADPALVALLAARTEALSTCSGATCRSLEDLPIVAGGAP